RVVGELGRGNAGAGDQVKGGVVRVDELDPEVALEGVAHLDLGEQVADGGRVVDGQRGVGGRAGGAGGAGIQDRDAQAGGVVAGGLRAGAARRAVAAVHAAQG